jgi:hypothetical protein
MECLKFVFLPVLCQVSDAVAKLKALGIIRDGPLGPDGEPLLQVGAAEPYMFAIGRGADGLCRAVFRTLKCCRRGWNTLQARCTSYLLGYLFSNTCQQYICFHIFPFFPFVPFVHAGFFNQHS